jgi:hypothetical protein
VQAAELRGEIDELKLKVAALETRIAAAELKHKDDLGTVHGQISAMGKELASLRGDLGNVESLLRANHLAEIHLWGVTARLLKLPDPEIREAQQHARRLLEEAPKR